MESFDIAIIGSGVAGACTAYHLAREGASRIILLDAEERAGVHASGRNAAMVRQVVSQPAIAALAREGARALAAPAPDLAGHVRFDRVGSLLLASSTAWGRLEKDASEARMAGIALEVLTAKDAAARVPALAADSFEQALHCPSDGLVEVETLLDGCLGVAAKHGAELRFATRVAAIDAAPGGGFVVTTSRGSFTARILVNAAGAWAAAIGRAAGAAHVPLTAYRRHLYATAPIAWDPARWPFVWDLDHGVYYRREGRGLLMSPCDEDEHEPGTPAMSAAAEKLLRAKLRHCSPALADVLLVKGLAGLRSFAADRNFVLGWDALRSGFFWVAGLGGHGVTAGLAVGALAARLVREGPGSKVAAFDPGRFAT